MKPFIILILICIFSCENQNIHKPNTVRELQHISQTLNRNVKIQVYLPKTYNQHQKTFSTLYILDGQFYFHYGVGFQQVHTWRDQTPEFVVVGIDCSDWEQRLTDFSSNTYQNRFMLFLKNELIPYMGNNYNVSNDRMIFGWQNAGNFVFNTMVDNTDLFNGYFSASGTWDDSLAIEQFKQKQLNTEKHFYYTYSTKEVWALNSFKKFDSHFQSVRKEHFTYGFETLPKEDHWSTSYRTLYNGLKSYFKPFEAIKFKTLESYKSFGGYEAVKEHYIKRGQKYFASVEIHPRTIANILNRTMRANDYAEFQFILNQNKKYVESIDRDFRYMRYAKFYKKHSNLEDAFKIINIGLREYPNSARIHATLAEILTSKNAINESIKSYQKAIELGTKYSDRNIDNYKLKLSKLKDQL